MGRVLGECRGMCEWGGCWRSVEACVDGGSVRHVWVGRVLGECGWGGCGGV